MRSEQAYQVEVVRSGDWWAITVPELDGVFSQAKRLDQVESQAREAIAMMLDIDETAVGPLKIHITPPATASDLLETLRTSVTVAAEAEAKAARIRLEAAMALRAEGLPMRDVGTLIGVSHQRVHQLLTG
ncbi:MAG: type II toxin-antitoxin system HicB family antitoxin [Acidimicrobiaceae bacterium]|nr:type II toxin-antitoxin system HicB family antitoxin [Acidimicrobiaceae bacterium]MXW75907.1 type II toxin-antitoxin system HicB family antitoxin [Acidimicrobiaceae bacterium]MYD07883.1 type II toxin-antitoxin system HicB family antitoxin [Acidimicrobiaceae bacterium]MYI58818.1 type II toxin-antitoxin system HicB family antitoxin [Acidimicrobiaceae bacterium]